MSNILKIEIEDEVLELKVVSAWEEITVDQYAEVQKVLETEANELEKSISVLSKLTGVDEDVFYSMYPEDFTKAAEMLTFLNEEVPQEKCESIMVEGEEYFIKDDFKKLTLGETISLELILERYGNNVLKGFPEMLCIFLRKKKDNGKLEVFKNSFMDRAQMFGKLPITKIQHLFFSTSTTEALFNNNMKDSLEVIK